MKQYKRHIIQAAAAFIANSNIAGFFKGTIWQGESKKICVPGLNCYSCPGALGSCPIGALQSQISAKRSFPFYVTGIILFFGVLFGRLICGFLCPFGFIQDLLHKIPIKKLRIPARADKLMRWLKYVVLAVFVIALPLLLTGDYGAGIPWFCKYICPAGTLEGGLPLAAANEGIRQSLGGLFWWKASLLAATVIASVLIYRPFCKYICPLGAIYGLLNRFSFYSMAVDGGKCTKCGACERACKMNVKVTANINSTECIRCGLCREVCPHGAISTTFARGQKIRLRGGFSDGGEM